MSPHERQPFQAELSAASGLLAPVLGQIARFGLSDGRRVDVHMPKAIDGTLESCDVAGFRVVVWRADGTASAELAASDLLDVFGAQAAAQSLDAFRAGDLPRARMLARKAGAAWRGLVRLLQEVAGRRLRRHTRKFAGR